MGAPRQQNMGVLFPDEQGHFMGKIIFYQFSLGFCFQALVAHRNETVLAKSGKNMKLVVNLLVPGNKFKLAGVYFIYRKAYVLVEKEQSGIKWIHGRLGKDDPGPWIDLLEGGYPATMVCMPVGDENKIHLGQVNVELPGIFNQGLIRPGIKKIFLLLASIYRQRPCFGVRFSFDVVFSTRVIIFMGFIPI